MNLLTRRLAAEFVTANGRHITAQGLADAASDGTGPVYGIVRGRALYKKEDLLRWLEEEFARPVTRRRERSKDAAA